MALMVMVAVAGSMMLPSLTSAGEKVFEEKKPRNPNDIIYGGRGVTGKSAVTGIVSLIVPGVGQLINENQGKKVATHFVVGLIGYVGFAHPVGFVFGLFHLWSGWDALIDRPGGYLDGILQAPGTEEILDAGLGMTSASC